MTDLLPIRVLIVDDHALVRSGIKDFLFAYDWMILAGEAENGLEAFEFCTSHEVDIVLMDMVMPLMDGSEATRRINSLGKPIKIIILTSFHEQDLVQQALQSGATSYLLKNVSAEELAAAIRATYDGFSTFAPEATKALVNGRAVKPGVGFDLTERERDVLVLLVGGFTNSEISSQLSISIATVKFHLTNIFSKLGVKNRVEAVTKAIEFDLA